MRIDINGPLILIVSDMLQRDHGAGGICGLAFPECWRLGDVGFELRAATPANDSGHAV